MGGVAAVVRDIIRAAEGVGRSVPEGSLEARNACTIGPSSSATSNREVLEFAQQSLTHSIHTSPWPFCRPAPWLLAARRWVQHSAEATHIAICAFR